MIGIIYKEILEFPGYRVGNDGSVWTAWKRGRYPKITEIWKIIKPGTDKRGYSYVTLYRSGFSKTFFVHTLVLTYFIGLRPDDMECCHNDGNPSNNILNNLRWDTKKANQADMLRHGTKCLGERSPVAKLTESQVLEIWDKIENGLTDIEISKEYNVTDSAIYCIKRGKSWRHLG